MRPNYRVIYVRLEQLKLAIDQRDQQAIEFEFDRVLRAVQKADRQETESPSTDPPKET